MIMASQYTRHGDQWRDNHEEVELEHVYLPIIKASCHWPECFIRLDRISCSADKSDLGESRSMWRESREIDSLLLREGHGRDI